MIIRTGTYYNILWSNMDTMIHESEKKYHCVASSFTSHNAASKITCIKMV